MERCVIIAGADIKNYDYVRSYIMDYDFVVCCDCGIRHISMLKIVPNLIIGDFDSSEKMYNNIETIILPREKDDTDSLYAIKECINRGFEKFLILGAIGNRFDHSFVNIGGLIYLYNKNKLAKIIDDYGEIEILGKSHKIIDRKFRYFSLLAINGVAKGVNIKNAKYNLKNGTINPEFQYGISNENLFNEEAEVWVEDGILLLIKINRE